MGGREYQSCHACRESGKVCTHGGWSDPASNPLGAINAFAAEEQRKYAASEFETDEEFTDRVIAEARARRGPAGDGSSLESEVGEWVWQQLHDPDVIALLTPQELEQVLVILRGVWARNVRGDAESG